MQSATPHWALSSGVIKAFKHHHPLSLHMSALQTVFVKRAVLSVVYLVSLSLLCRFSLMQRGHEKCTVHFNIYSNKSFNNKIRASSAGPQREIMTLLQWLHPLSRDARIPIFAQRTKHGLLRSSLCSFTCLPWGSNTGTLQYFYLVSL